MNAMQKTLLYIFLSFSIIFICLLPLEPYASNFAIKAIPAISLAALAFIAVTGLRGKLLFTSLLFCAAADIALELRMEMSFIIGLGLFLFAHILFIATFSRDLKAQKSKLSIIILLAVYAIMMGFVLTPQLQEMAIPVYIYLMAITLMGIFAALRASENDFTLYGAIAFIVSDSILAINKFMMPVPAADYLIMITYYLSLFLIVYGFLKK